MLGKVLQLVPQLLWPLMWNTCTSLDVTLSGNLIQTIITSPFCFHLQVKEWKPWCYFGEKISKTDVFVSLTLEDSAPQCAVPTRQLDCPHRGSFTLQLPLCNDLVTGSLFVLFSSSSLSPVSGGWVRAPADSRSPVPSGSNEDPVTPLCLTVRHKQQDLPSLQILWSRAEDCGCCCIHYQPIAAGQCSGWRLCLLYWHPSNSGKCWIKQERQWENVMLISQE